MTQSYLAHGNNKELIVQGRKVVFKKFSYAVQKEITALTQDKKLNESIDRFLLSSIESWDLVDDNDKLLPISIESINQLASEFATELVEESTKFNSVTPEETKN